MYIYIYYIGIQNYNIFLIFVKNTFLILLYDCLFYNNSYISENLNTFGIYLWTYFLI